MENERYEQIGRVVEDMEVTIEFSENNRNGKKICREIREILLQELRAGCGKSREPFRIEKEGDTDE